MGGKVIHCQDVFLVYSSFLWEQHVPGHWNQKVVYDTLWRVYDAQNTVQEVSQSVVKCRKESQSVIKCCHMCVGGQVPVDKSGKVRTLGPTNVDHVCHNSSLHGSFIGGDP